MAISRRRFVTAAGVGAAGAWIGARGREHAIWSAFSPTLGAVAPGTIVLASNENPLGPGKAVMKAKARRAKARAKKVRARAKARRPTSAATVCRAA